MAQINSNWTAPTFSFDAADHPTAWRCFYLSAQDYLETLRIKPEEEDPQKRGWEQITTMFTGENRQILQNLIDNNTITATDQRTPILVLKAIQSAIKDGKHYQNSATRSSTKCPWKQFYKCIIKYMNSLQAQPCEPQMKIDTFVSAIRNSFPNKTSTKQTQTTEQPRKMALDPSSNTSNSDTNSAYNTETESNCTECLPRPSKSQQITSRGPKLCVSPFQITQKATTRPAISAPQHVHKSQALPHGQTPKLL